MKRSGILLAALLMMQLPVQRAEAADLMNFRMDAEQTAFSTEMLEKGGAVTHGALYIENYTGISQMRLILKCDAPLAIENGDFTRDSSREERDGSAKHAYFSDHSAAEYLQHSEETGISNAILWYGPETGEGGGRYYAVGELDDPDSSFVNFDIRIPKDTPVGEYLCYVSTDFKYLAPTLQPDLIEEDSFVYKSGVQQIFGKDMTLEPVKIAVYRRGDFDSSGKVDVTDAQLVLLTAVERSIGKSSDLTLVQSNAADVNADSDISVTDAQFILNYYVQNTILETVTSWDTILK